MAYRFTASDQTVEAGVRRIACEQIDEALTLLASKELTPERIVHGVRQRCKRLRAILRLVRPAFATYATEDAAFRDIARLLSGSRDAKVMADALDMVAADGKAAPDPASLGRLRKMLTRQSGEIAPPRETVDQCAELLRGARHRAERWSLDADGWDALSGGLIRTYRQARRSMHALAANDDVALSHLWRKHVKYHGFHTELLRSIAPDAMGRRATRLSRLADRLGARHDLDLLVVALAERPKRLSDGAMIDELAACARQRIAALEKKAQRSGRRLFEARPRKLVDQWDARWRDWRSRPARRDCADA